MQIGSDLMTWEAGINHLNKNLAGTEILAYYIHDNAGYEEIGYGYGTASAHSDIEEDYISSTFDSIDQHIDLDFSRTYDNNASDIDIVLTFGNIIEHAFQELNNNYLYKKHFCDIALLKKKFKKITERNDLIYIKGSRLMQLERIYS